MIELDAVHETVAECAVGTVAGTEIVMVGAVTVAPVVGVATVTVVGLGALAQVRTLPDSEQPVAGRPEIVKVTVAGGGGNVIATVAVPLLVLSCVEVAVTVALADVPEGVRTPV